MSKYKVGDEVTLIAINMAEGMSLLYPDMIYKIFLVFGPVLPWSGQYYYLEGTVEYRLGGNLIRNTQFLAYESELQFYTPLNEDTEILL